MIIRLTKRYYIITRPFQVRREDGPGSSTRVWPGTKGGLTGSAEKSTSPPVESGGTSVGGGAPIGYTPDCTQHRQENPAIDDTFTRWQIIAYLEEIPLGYVTERDHEIAEKLITRAQRHFAELSTDWEPDQD